MTVCLVLAAILGYSVSAAWPAAGFVILMADALEVDPPQAVRAVYHELQPFYLPAVVVAFVAGSLLHRPDWLSGLWLVAGIGLWAALRDLDDDDRWTRRRERLAEKVEAVAGRLVVVPVGS